MVWWGRISPARAHCWHGAVTNCGLELRSYQARSIERRRDTVQLALHAAQVTRLVNCVQRPSPVPIQGDQHVVWLR